MRKILFRAFILCSLIPSMWLSVANAVGVDAECLSLEKDSGAIFSVCLEGDVNKAKLTNKTKSQLLELAHQLKAGAVVESKAKARVSAMGSVVQAAPITPDYTDEYSNYTDEYSDTTNYADEYSDYTDEYTGAEEPDTNPNVPEDPSEEVVDIDYNDNYSGDA